jgi:hypothetical protein
MAVEFVHETLADDGGRTDWASAAIREHRGDEYVRAPRRLLNESHQVRAWMASTITRSMLSVNLLSSLWVLFVRHK